MTKLSNYQKARSRLLLSHMFFAAFALSTEFVEDRNIPTACTDMKKVWYNPDFMDSLDVETCMFVIVHEIYHMILMHGFRFKAVGGSQHKLWNIACDHAINLQLKAAGFKVWEHAYCDPKYAGMSAEQIFAKLREQGDGSDVEPDGLGEDLAPVKGDQAEVDQATRDIRQRVTQAATAARAAGKLPADIAILVDGVVRPPQPWYTLLRDLMTRVVNEEETWTRRNRRHDAVLPSRSSAGMGPIVFIGDTSGSMLHDRVYAQVAAEIEEAREQTRPESVIAVWADHCECAFEEQFQDGEPILLHPRGGGGTDMRLPLAYVRKHTPDVVVMVTDCATPWPDAPEAYPLIVLSTDARAKGPEWATTIHIR